MTWRPSRAWTVVWLVSLALLQAGVAAAVVRLFLGSVSGQRVEMAALEGSSLGRDRIATLVDSVLDPISALAVIGAVAVVAFIALARRRLLLAAAAGALIVGANITTQVLKRLVIDRPNLGVDAAHLTPNSLPSGHTTVAASIVLALVFVVPPRLRGLVAMGGAAYAGLIGIATLAAGWHRPSDVIVAYLVVGAWAAVVGVLLVRAQHPPADRAPRAEAHPVTATLLALSGVALTLVSLAALWATVGLVPADYTRRALLVAYAGGAAGIAGAACLVTVALLLVIHRTVPPRLPEAPPPSGSTTNRAPTPGSSTTR